MKEKSKGKKINIYEDRNACYGYMKKPDVHIQKQK